MATRGCGSRTMCAVVIASPIAVAALPWTPVGDALGAARAIQGVTLVLALTLMLRAARRGDHAMRRPRLLMSAGLASAVLASLTVVAYQAVDGVVPIPSLADPIYLLWIPFVAAGMWMVPGRGALAATSLRTVAEIALIVSSTTMVSWLLVLGPVWASPHWSSGDKLVQLGFPLGDIIVIAIAIALVPRARPDLRRMLSVAALGVVCIAVADSASVAASSQTGELHYGWPDVALQVGIALTALSSRIQADGTLDRSRRQVLLDRALPFVPSIAAVPIGLGYIAIVGPLSFVHTIPAALMVVSLIGQQAISSRELSDALRRHEHDTSHDALTGLRNRSSLLERLTVVLAVPDRPPAALLLIDLDGFKEINDTFGHDHGDTVLRYFAERLRTLVGGKGLAVRLGGDEFAVLLVGPDAVAATHAIGVELGTWSEVSAGATRQVQVLASVGMTALHPGDLPVDVLRRADLAMYDAKRSNRLPRLTVHSDELGLRSQRRSLLAADLGAAASRGELRLVFQPLIELDSERVHGAESLLRWDHPVFGAIPPAEFIPIAEDSGHMDLIGEWVLEHAIKQLHEWDTQGLVLNRIFVNVSAHQLTPDFCDLVRRVLTRYAIDGERLVVEVTESQSTDLAADATVRRLRGVGVQVALDDFGAGYSTLAQLSRMPVDVLKIDREFVADLGTPTGRRVIEAVVALANSLQMITVLEGIEEPEHAAAARAAGIDLGQGFHFSRPLEPAALGDLLRQRRPLPAGVVPSARPGEVSAQVL